MRAATTPATMPAMDLVLKGLDEGGDATRVPNGVVDPGFVAGVVTDGVLGDVPDGVLGGVSDEEFVLPGGDGVLEGLLTFAANFIPSAQ